MRAREREGSGAHERVIGQFPRRSESQIRGNERELRVHGRRSNIPPFLERVLIQRGFAVTGRDQPA